jgi:hypothetical protein
MLNLDLGWGVKTVETVATASGLPSPRFKPWAKALKINSNGFNRLISYKLIRRSALRHNKNPYFTVFAAKKHTICVLIYSCF